jgi:aminomethyltransferase
MSTEQLSKTPLHALHLELGARMVPFAGYDMPVQYPLGVMKEHLHTREQAGLFDVSHMGQIRLTGANAAKALETLVPVDIIDLPVGMQRYAMFTNDNGGILDDLMVANLGNDELFLVVNAACKDQDLAHLQKHIGDQCTIGAVRRTRAAGPARPGGVKVLARLAPEVAKMTFMQFACSCWAWTASSAARATPVKTASRFPCRQPMPKNWPAPCWPNRKSRPSAWAPATRCAWKPACACTATT